MSWTHRHLLVSVSLIPFTTGWMGAYLYVPHPLRTIVLPAFPPEGRVFRGAVGAQDRRQG